MDYDNISDSDDELLGKSLSPQAPSIPQPITSTYNKYIKLKEVHGVLGYIIYVHDGANFDIDLFLPSEIEHLYSGIIKNEYFYHELDSGYFKNGKFENNNVKKGTTYRCRLRGIGINKLPSSIHTRKSSLITNEVQKIVDRVDGWVICTISDIDIHSRLLIDVKISIGNDNIDLKKFLLKRMEDPDWKSNPIYYSYPKIFHLPG